ncbi:hypothetical protein GLYMA_03G145500v4 [Glycine max]|uniref:WRC domain-containing protein n=1 Tax=Glycine max TaxID=3847 RepID=I1JNL6_SOYBN|nr:uncharacterized protein LOC100781689 [Glycine max]KAG5072284.1 hypothetical protein JHK86_007495 [Glycine max]KAH1070026.1 hypothetical protein GYH30_007238 [Glycine max]KAH1258199.1 hypothetical protein GmHk_03G007986 [Glycine max]KRH67077.1 hypothetical protein GLYMA_03G145500v4 [Glycine max]|eukprot:XP_003521217.1 uncharacterized protein LOC100781689 [Glycine max]
MRIRKRPALFPSSLSPLRLSDPHLINRSPVVVQLSDATSTAPKLSFSSSAHHAAFAHPSTLDRFQPSDQPLPLIGKQSNGSDDPSGIGESGAHRQHNKQDPLDEVVRREESGEDSGEKGNHIRKGRTFDSEKTQAELLPPLSSSSTQDGRWYEGEKAIPLKKRRGNFEENNNNNNAAAHSKKMMKAKMKTKMNKKCSTPRNNEDSTGEEEVKKKVEETIKVEVNVVSKKRARGSALMEGSRCSRVNGRGWRCCQQTLVGYSLCEHHLGKGRLRSMTSVRSRSIIASTAPKEVHVHHVPHPSSSSPSFCSLEKQIECVDDAEPFGEKEEKKPGIIMTSTKKRMKLGMVKARSISSLLGQTSNHIAAVAHENSK